MDIVDRLIKIREDKGYSQEKFALELGLSRNFINQVENRKKNISDRTVSDICREFNVNEDWLRNGTGEMFRPISKSDQIADMISDVMKSDEEDFKRRLISALARLDNDGWENLENLIDMISGKK